MEVHPDEGGVTKTVGGLQWIILPAVRCACFEDGFVPYRMDRLTRCGQFDAAGCRDTLDRQCGAWG